MIKHFCDICGREIEPGSAKLSTTIEKNGIKLELDVISSVSGDICRYCILDALAALDDRLSSPETPPRFPSPLDCYP